jgi:RNA polymerase sigma-70 factor (ECF subfamily)
MLRDVQGLSTAEAAETLGLGEEAVKTRLHRGRVMLRRVLTVRFGETQPPSHSMRRVAIV